MYTDPYLIVKVTGNVSRKLRNKLSKIIVGNTVIINGKKYRSKGIVEKLGGKILCPGTYLVPTDKYSEFIDYLRHRRFEDYIVVIGTCKCIKTA